MAWPKIHQVRLLHAQQARKVFRDGSTSTDQSRRSTALWGGGHQAGGSLRRQSEGFLASAVVWATRGRCGRLHRLLNLGRDGPFEDIGSTPECTLSLLPVPLLADQFSKLGFDL